MKNTILTKILFTTSVLIGAALHLYYWPLLPDRIANHFGSNGYPNGWISKTSNAIMNIGVLIFIFVLIETINFLTKKDKLSFKYISIPFPNKEFWLSVDKKDDSIAYISSVLRITGTMINFYIIIIAYSIFVANTQQPVILKNNYIFALTVIVLIIITVLAAVPYVRFRKTT